MRSWPGCKYSQSSENLQIVSDLGGDLGDDPGDEQHVVNAQHCRELEKDTMA